MLQFLVVGDSFAVDPGAAEKSLGESAQPLLSAALAALRDVSPFVTADIKAALQSSLVDGLGLKAKVAFGPVRVAVTGSTVSPPLYESIELLGRDVTLARLESALGYSGQRS
jgi:glutamyl-tRNA synthetase